MTIFTINEFERSFKDLYRPLCLFALRFIEQPDDAEDIVQQAFADVWDKQRQTLTILNLKAYMYRSVRNRSLNFLDKTTNLQPVDTLPDSADESLDEQIRISERDTRLWDAIDKLPQERKKIFLLSKRDGLKYREIAEELNLSVKTVENQIGKALKTLRESAVHIYMFFFCKIVFRNRGFPAYPCRMDSITIDKDDEDEKNGVLRFVDDGFMVCKRAMVCNPRSRNDSNTAG
jgi:RNA polymerase sigma-70 factor (ECF subfamily)